jgi:hypothetical protein
VHVHEVKLYDPRCYLLSLALCADKQFLFISGGDGAMELDSAMASAADGAPRSSDGMALQDLTSKRSAL